MSEHGLKTHRLLHQENDAYFAESGVSATLLDYMNISPAHGKAYLDGEMTEETESMRLGTLCHTAIFQPDLLTESNFHFQPDYILLEKERVAKLSSAIPVLDESGKPVEEDGKIQVVWNARIAECKQWNEDHKDKEIISANDWKKATRIRDNAHRNGIVRGLLSQGESEMSLFVEDELGTLRKCRFDYFSLSGNAIPDLKTTRSAHPDDYEKTLLNNRLFQRAAFYLDNANLAGIPKTTFILICVETAPPYLVAVYQIPDEIIEYGRRIYKADLQRYRNCMETGKWPGYFDGIREIWLPAWAMKQMQEL